MDNAATMRGVRQGLYADENVMRFGELDGKRFVI